MRTIALEEHFVTQAFMQGPGRGMEQILEAFARSSMKTTAAQVIDRLLDLGQGRVSEMGAAGIDMQVLSLTRGVEGAQDDIEAANLARDSNQVLAEAVKQYPTFLAGFASLRVLTPGQGRRRVGTCSERARS
jgi:predicted TIM-barrel fold metal-dependent hydrolase